MRELEMDHNCLTSADNTASGSPREQVLPDIRTSHPQRRRCTSSVERVGVDSVQTGQRGSSWGVTSWLEPANIQYGFPEKK